MTFNLTAANRKKLNDLKDYFKKYKTLNNNTLELKVFFTQFIDLVNYSGVSDFNFVLENFSTDKIGSTIITQLNNKILAKKYFNANHSSRKYICNAPYTTLNFDKTGNINVCCYSRSFSLGSFPKNSIKEVWFGAYLDHMRKSLAEFDFSKGCDLCFNQIKTGNFKNSLLHKFDFYSNYTNNQFPSVFEFEITNICNYECIMCGGYFSSSIRKNREKLDPLKQVYDNNFVDQLKEFIPHLKVCNFLGGEPFLTPIYYKIWNEILNLNPNINVFATTNGSILNNKVKETVLSLPNFKLIFSLDSLNENTYSFIRKNGNLKTVLETFNFFNDLNRVAGIAFCPMIQNIYELPNIIEFCIKYNIDLSINTVRGPLGGRIKGIHENGVKDTVSYFNLKDKITEVSASLLPEVSIYTLAESKKEEIIKFLSKFKFKTYYQSRLDGVISSLKSSTM